MSCNGLKCRITNSDVPEKKWSRNRNNFFSNIFLLLNIRLKNISERERRDMSTAKRMRPKREHKMTEVHYRKK